MQPRTPRDCRLRAIISPAASATLVRSRLQHGFLITLTRSWAGRRAPSTALPAPFVPAVLPCWPFPCGDGVPQSARPFNARVMRNRECKRKEQTMQNTERQDIYTRITGKIVASLEAGVRPWIRPWSGENAAGRITRPLRHNGMPYSGINILMLWASSVEQGFASPSWMTFRQAIELNACVRKGEKGSLVVYANSVTKTEKNDAGEDVERDIHFLKGYTVFNVEQIEGLPERYRSEEHTSERRVGKECSRPRSEDH